MSTLICVGTFYPSMVGGSGVVMYWAGRAIAESGEKVTVVTTRSGVKDETLWQEKWVEFEGMNIAYLSCNSFSIMGRTLTAISQLPKHKTVILASLFSKPHIFIALIALLMGKRIIWGMHGELLFRRGRIKRIFISVVKLIFSKKILFHATSPEEVESIRQNMGDNAKCALVPNYMYLPVNVEVKTDEKYLLYVGRIAKIKALEKLIEGISKSKLFTNQGYKLYLAGENKGEYYEGLLSLVKELGLEESVIFKGMVEGSDKEFLYAGAKATLLVSYSENFGNVIIESLAQGTPAITSKGTPWQILEQSGVGYWIDNSPEVIGETVDKLLSLPESDYLKMREKSYRLCTAEFDIKTNINKWLEIL